MITMRIKGGLGNQLFQYAAAYALSKRLCQPFRFNPSFSANMTERGYKLSELNVDIDTVVKDDDLPVWITLRKNIYINKFSRMVNISKMKIGDTLYWLETKDTWLSDFFLINEKNIYVDGYFQSYKYFHTYRKELVEQFQPNYDPEPEYISALEKIKNTNSVAVHVRRCDFKKDRHRFHYILDADYYKKAIQHIRDAVDHPIFFWFSDDMDWIKEHIGDEIDFVFVNLKTTHGDIDDMMLMKNCNHIITANSTFSWWAAWLNENEDAIRVVPKKPYGMEGMIPKGWIRV